MSLFTNYTGLRVRDGTLRYMKRGVYLPGAIELSLHGLWRKTARQLVAHVREVLPVTRHPDGFNKELHETLNHPTAAGRILRRYVRKAAARFREGKAPVSGETHVGIEIEFISKASRQGIADVFTAAGLVNHVTYHPDGSVRDADSCDGSCRDGCDCVDDGCCECGCESNGHEVCVLSPVSKVESIINRVCAVLNSSAIKATVNKTCGLHVHLDARNRGPDTIYNRLFNALPMLASFVPKTRWTNHFCKPNTSPNRRGVPDRYHAINPKSYRKHTTIEVRLHSGTTDPAKITAWVKLLVFLAYKKRSPKPVESFRRLLDAGLDLGTVFYFVGRFHKFGHDAMMWRPTDGELFRDQLTENEVA